MLPRFFVPAADTSGSIVDLPDEEAAHLVRVLRLGPGAAVEIFNGRGVQWRATVERATKSGASARLDVTTAAAAESAVPVTLAAAVLKGDKSDDVVRDAVMLGVAALQPLLTDRSEVRESTLVRARRVDRWQRIAIASAKQCGRAVVPNVHDPCDVTAAIARPAPGARLALVEPGAVVTPGAIRRVEELTRPAQAELLVGPEGGWSEREVQALAAAAMLLTLRAPTLRADAVPLVALTALRVAWNDL